MLHDKSALHSRGRLTLQLGSLVASAKAQPLHFAGRGAALFLMAVGTITVARTVGEWAWAFGYYVGAN